jgi:hypothetical protein
METLILHRAEGGDEAALSSARCKVGVFVKKKSVPHWC